MIVTMKPRPSLARDERGIALIEFAFVLPFLVLLFIGGFQLMDGISAYRKVGSTVRALADLTTQNTTINPGQADEILAAAQQIMVPYSPAAAVLRISQIQVDGTGKATVTWSRASNGLKLATGSNIVIPETLKQPNRYYVFSEIIYTYTPRIASGMIGRIPFSQTIYMSPRNSEFIVCDTCT